MKTINVKSEYGKLKTVLLHRPGAETENISPSTYEELLFEDAYYLKVAQAEHDEFANVLRNNGVKVLYLEDLVTEVLELGKEIKTKFIKQFITEANVTVDSNLFKEIEDYFNTFEETRTLVLKMMAGVRFDELPKKYESGLLRLSTEDMFVLKPMPNLIFTRDPFSTIGNGVSLHTMTFETRKRETIFGEYIFKYHLDYKDIRLYYDRHQNSNIEGGDVMILTDKSIAVGISQRTSGDSLEKLAKNIFADKESTIETIYGINIPKGRSWMHLDTVFTQIDKNVFSIFVSGYKFDIYKITKKSADKYAVEKVKKDIAEIMKEAFKGEEVKLIVCGNDDPLISEREQWNDGSNVLAIAPNTVITYNRNYVTNKALRDAGVNVLEISSSELSRGRGGPRCMSMPLQREDLK